MLKSLKLSNIDITQTIENINTIFDLLWDTPRDFIDRAYQIRNKQYPENEGYLSCKPSKYNKNVLRGKCVKCKKKLSTETHHILQQKDADKNGFVNGVHKNHAANLMVLCEDCHLKEHH